VNEALSKVGSIVWAGHWTRESELRTASLRALAEGLAAARHVVALTGAGISAESGVPTFREAQTGLWAEFDAAELAAPEAFERAPQRVWDWYAWRRELIAGARPNAGHAAIVELERRVAAFTLVTQNVDGLHQRAGSGRVIELHGNIGRTRCSAEGQVVDHWVDRQPGPPVCPRCGAPLRPDVVWFGEPLPFDALDEAERAARRCDVLLTVGTSSVVYPAAALPAIAAQHGALIIVVNPEATDACRLPGAVHLAGPAGTVLPALADAIPLRDSVRES
jgi:NAD-dependent protein deacetylase/lipoamidase